MDSELIEKETRFAIIRYLVNKLGDVGKTKIQKLIYFLQEAFDVPLSYVYTMYYFGPYSEELDNDLLDMKLQDYFNIEPDPAGYGYHVRPGNETIASIANTIKPYARQLDECVDRFGDFPALYLELLGTLYFVKHSEDKLTKEEIIKKVKILKPKFDISKVEEHYEKLEGLVRT
ncbi:unnamed protein product [marine sediment metagenome]|uniref:Antitoxin SocA-like Panacea domain-containing protein n=1 Tax=marine sediment metagenome TaxID=412755 RepID=X1J162_9ZZZZ